MALPINALSFCATSYYKQLFLTKFLYALRFSLDTWLKSKAHATESVAPSQS